MKFKKLPIGIEFFADMIGKDYYYVDKTGMIKELLENVGSVNLFTRPRRFGKTLNMDMLKCFFEIGADKSLFDGLAISRETELCEKHMGKYPVLTFSLKQVQGFDYEDAKQRMWSQIGYEADRYSFLRDSDKLDEADKNMILSFKQKRGDLAEAIKELSKLLYKHYGRKVIILIDEYDVPLQKAEQDGFYPEMVKLIGGIFSAGMKTNPYMEFAVVTGCLRVSKESIFTGFNNPKMHTILDERYDEWFGFTDDEVQKLLADYGQSDYYEITKEWYDGYLFGKTHVYCPWDVINWCDKLVHTGDRFPENYWANSSGNQMISRFAAMAESETKAELEQLLEGKTVWKKINMELTYNELEDSVENLWSVLFMTGYLTFRGRNEAGEYELVIPNREIQSLFRDMIDKWFKEMVIGDLDNLRPFFESLETFNGEGLEETINYCLEESISYLDGGKQKEKESFYHGMLIGMLKARTGWNVRSNREAGEGRLDIITYPKRGRSAIIFECKAVRKYTELEKAAQEALRQIADRKYDSFFEERPTKEVVHIGIAFCKKRCRVLIEKKC